MSQADNHSNSESFYSIDNSKSEFTFVEQPQPLEETLPQQKQQILPINVQGILQKFDIRQSSAVELQSSDLVNQSFQSVVSKANKDMNVHDISAIDQKEMNELECSMCLQNQIECLSVPETITPEEMKSLNVKMDRLKNQQALLRKQISIFQEAIMQDQKKNSQMAAQIVQANKFIKKKCDHESQSSHPFYIPINQASRTQITMKRQESSSPRKEQTVQKKKRFDIKPNRGQTASQKQANAKYKECSFNREATLYEDLSNQFRVQLKYQSDVLVITLTNFQKGQTNFIHAARINQPDFFEKISEKIYFPLKNYTPKKFTLSMSIMLLIFEQGKQKQQGNLIKIEEIRSISIPLPINYFIETRFNTLPKQDEFLSRIMRRLYVYEIDINYNADYAAYKQLRMLEWIQTKWISLRGSTRLIHAEIGEIKERDSGFGVVFRIGCKEKDCQEAIDLIEYLCFMLAI